MASSSGNPTSILLVSKTGNGKSSLANALLNTSEFQVGRGMLSITAHCKCISTPARDRDLTVVDTPGTMDVEDEEKAKTEIRRAIRFCPQGFDVFLVVVKCDARFTAEERRAIEVVAEMFGDVFYKHAIVVFSHGDEFDNDEAEFRKELQETRKKIPYLDQLLTRCGNRFILVDNGRRCEKAVQDRQMEALLSLADGLVTSNGGKKYTSAELEVEKKRAEEERLEIDKQVNAQLAVRMEQMRQQQREPPTQMIDGTLISRIVLESLLRMGASTLLSYLTRSALPPVEQPLQLDSGRGPSLPPPAAASVDLFRQRRPIFQIQDLGCQAMSIRSSPSSMPWNLWQDSPDRLQRMLSPSSAQFGRMQTPMLAIADTASGALSASRDLPSSILSGNLQQPDFLRTTDRSNPVTGENVSSFDINQELRSDRGSERGTAATTDAVANDAAATAEEVTVAPAEAAEGGYDEEETF